MPDAQNLIAQFCSSQARLFGPRNPTRDGDQHPFAIPAQARFQSRLQVSALRADSRREEPQVRGRGADAFHRFQVRGSDDEADVGADSGGGTA